MKLLPDKVIVGSTEINDVWLYYYLGSHYYNHYYCFLINEYPENVDEINTLFSHKVINKCKGNPGLELSPYEITIIKTHFLNILSDKQDLTSGLIFSKHDLNKYKFDDYINIWITVKEIFAIAYYVCMSVQSDFRHYLPEGYFFSLKKDNDNYDIVKINNIESCIFDFMNHILMTNPDVVIYRELYPKLSKFNLLSTLLMDDLYRPKTDCIII